MTKKKLTIACMLSASLAASPLVASAFPDAVPQDTQPAFRAPTSQRPITYEQWQEYFQGTLALSHNSSLNMSYYEGGRILYKSLGKSQEWLDHTLAFAVRVCTMDPVLSFDTWQTVFACAGTLLPEGMSQSPDTILELVSQDKETFQAACMAYSCGLRNFDYHNAVRRIKSIPLGIENTTAHLYDTFMKAYAKRAIHNGVYSLDQAQFIVSLLLTNHMSSLTWITTRTGNWDLNLLKDIADRTPDLLPHDKALLKTHVALLEEEIRLAFNKPPKGRELYEKILHDLTPYETQDPTCMSLFDTATYYVHMAKAYYGLKRGADCINAWNVAHSLKGRASFVETRYLEDAMRHLSVYCKSPRIHEKFWRTFLQDSVLTLDNFQPSFFDLEVLSLPAPPSQLVELNGEFVTYLHALVTYLKGPGMALDTPQMHPKYEHVLLTSTLRLAQLGSVDILFKP